MTTGPTDSTVPRARNHFLPYKSDNVPIMGVTKKVTMAAPPAAKFNHLPLSCWACLQMGSCIRLRQCVSSKAVLLNFDAKTRVVTLGRSEMINPREKTRKNTQTKMFRPLEKRICRHMERLARWCCAMSQQCQKQCQKQCRKLRCT